ncbi:hypothetical protein [Aliiroseovarius halocynthiae]|nr:hypothetical protein [Aliiroseovarius halocynthiae]
MTNAERIGLSMQPGRKSWKQFGDTSLKTSVQQVTSKDALQV